MNLQAILGRGYFPRELPPAFTTNSFASVIDGSLASLPSGFRFRPRGNVTSQASIHNLARAGTLRRKLSIPNPVNYFQLSSAIVDSWNALFKQMSQSRFSLSRPERKPGTTRAILPIRPFDHLPHAR